MHVDARPGLFDVEAMRLVEIDEVLVARMASARQAASSSLTTADHDDRVVPGHSFKYAATLQAAQGDSAPVLIRIETRAGHGGGMPVSKLIELATDQWAFLVRNLGMTPQSQ